MELLFNDMSLKDGQFRDVHSFCEALGHIMKMWEVAEKHSRAISRHQLFSSSQPLNGMPIKQAVHRGFAGDRDRVRSVQGWLDKGPFWDTPDNRLHGAGDAMEVDGESVTNHAPAEAAFRQVRRSPCGLVSMTHPSWKCSPVTVHWAEHGPVNVENWSSHGTLEEALRDLEQPVRSWEELENRVRDRCDRLQFSSGCFMEVKSVPFSVPYADGALSLFGVLNELMQERDEHGSWTAKGRQIHTKYFRGEDPSFSDSSDSEKQSMAARLTFSGPDGKPQLYSWHGKVGHRKSPHGPLRFHFEWPVAGNTVYVPYFGPKLTKK